MSADWPEFQLGERCTVKSSKRIFAHEYVESGIPFMRSKDVIDKALGSFVDYDLYISEERFSEIKKTHGSPIKGDLLMSSVGNRSGQPYVIQDESDFHFKDGNILWLSEFNDINSDYLAYWLKSDIGQDALASVMIGSAQKALTIDSIRKLWVKFPSIEYQDRAAEILLSLDNKIELNRQTNQTLEYIAQAIFKSWFVDFEPTKAKIGAKESGQDPELAAMAAISGKPLTELYQLTPEKYQELKTTAALFPDSLVDSELGQIPEGWEATILGNYLEIKRGGSPRPIKDYIVEKGLPWTKIADATKEPSPFLFKTKECIKEEGLKKTVLLKKGSLILSNSATPGIPKFLELDACIHDGWLHFPHKKLFTDVYLYHLFLKIRKELIAQGNGSVFTNLKTDILRNQVVVVPTQEVINRFDNSVSLIFQKLKESCKEINYLEDIRNSLLPKLLSGELNPKSIK